MCEANLLCLLSLITILTIPEAPSVAIGGSSHYGVLEVPFGETIVLECRSNSGYYNFDYWIVENGAVVIGPANEGYDNVKYKYEVLSGNLTVRRVSKQEEGIYSCVSKAIRGNDIKIERVKMLVVLKNFEYAYEHDQNINTIRILIILISLVLLGIGAYVVFRIWKDRFRHPGYLGDDGEDENGEEIFISPGVSGISRSRSPASIVVDEDKEGNFENFNVRTDFENFLDTSNKDSN